LTQGDLNESVSHHGAWRNPALLAEGFASNPRLLQCRCRAIVHHVRKALFHYFLNIARGAVGIFKIRYIHYGTIHRSPSNARHGGEIRGFPQFSCAQAPLMTLFRAKSGL
jgi:hypothetical protein